MGTRWRLRFGSIAPSPSGYAAIKRLIDAVLARGLQAVSGTRMVAGAGSRRSGHHPVASLIPHFAAVACGSRSRRTVG